jgi:hypothetical protein
VSAMMAVMDDISTPAQAADDADLLPLAGLDDGGCVGAHCAPLHDAPAPKTPPAPAPGGCACQHDA